MWKLTVLSAMASSIGDLLVAVAVPNEPEHLELSGGEVFLAEMFGEASRHLWRDVPSAGMDRSHHRQQLVLRHALEKVGRSARSHRALDLAVAVRRREHDDARPGELSANRDEGVRSVGAWKPKVHQRDVRPMVAELRHGLHAFVA